MANDRLSETGNIPPSRALVPVDDRPQAPRLSDARPLAGFVTQLIACQRRLPGFRARRMADPAEASLRYDRIERRPDPARRVFERIF